MKTIESELRWYLRKAIGSDPRTLGPWTLQEICARLKNSRLAWIDLAIAALPGEKEWRPLVEIALVREAMGLDREPHGSTGSNPTRARAGGWIIRAQTDQTRSALGPMSGPYPLAIVREKLAAGELSYMDEAWREGLNRWVRLGDTPEAGGRAPSAVLKNAVASVPEEESAARLLGSVVRARPGLVRAAENLEIVEPPPPEADGVDLVPRPEWMRFLPALLLSVFAGLNARAADVLAIVPMKLATPEPSLVFNTDAKIDEKIHVSIKGQSGEILELKSFHREVDVTRGPGEVASLALHDWKLPAGRYHVEASAGKAAAEADIFVGRRDAAFEAELARHQKEISGEQQEERKSIFYASQKLQDLSRQLGQRFEELRADPKAWSRYRETWGKKVDSAGGKVKELVQTADPAYPEQIEAFAKAWKRLQDAATGLDQAVRGERTPASESDDLAREKTEAAGIAEDFKRLFHEAAELTSSGSSSGASPADADADADAPAAKGK